MPSCAMASGSSESTFMIAIREATQADIKTLYDLYDRIGKKDSGYFEECFRIKSTILIGALDGDDSGFCILNWTPRYSLYKTLGIPEIQDLNVVPEARRNGVARELIRQCEALALTTGNEAIGISVGLTKEYGAAQILYTLMGYVPDGYGVTYDREGVQSHRSYPLDDNLSLMMIKQL